MREKKEKYSFEETKGVEQIVYSCTICTHFNETLFCSAYTCF